MDPVSEILSERERSRPRLLPWVGAAALLHVGAAASIFLVSRSASARPTHLPAVSVRIVQPPRPPAQRQGQPRPRPTVAPAATPVPEPPSTPVPAATPVPQPTAGPREPPSEQAMPAPDARPAAAVTPAAEPEGAAAAQEGRGLSLGEGGGSRTPGIPADFQFTYYVERMLALIESRWYKPAAGTGTRAQVRFRILRTGRVDDIVLEHASGNPSFDRAALRALYAANPLPPLPPAYGKPDLTVHLSFTE
jgi:TonB family protein